MRCNNELKSQLYSSKTSGGVAGLCIPATRFPLKSFSYFFSRWDVVCLCIQWVVQNTKQHPFLTHAGSVYTLFFPFLFLSSYTLGPAKPLKAPKVDKQLGRLALYWEGRTYPHAHTHAHTPCVHAYTYAHAHTYTRTHTYVHAYKQTCT
jgi:hypothetical protein